MNGEESTDGVNPIEAPSTPTDAELLHLWDKFVGEPTEKCPLIDKDKTRYARAVLAAFGVDSGDGAKNV